MRPAIASNEASPRPVKTMGFGPAAVHAPPKAPGADGAFLFVAATALAAWARSAAACASVKPTFGSPAVRRE